MEEKERIRVELHSELAICDDRDRWRKKKEAEFYNQLYNKDFT